ncbi:hypothetical protein HPB51_017481 [Rhipicephalus microplus]|uniref:Peptidase M13 N-terminal domain-containing protein n=1 Tax=Rhipicephalus microplus TaxID=6941 RepID=A0A9J6F5B0_RHIMP|nr:hypothetical protein HPB51_017481 [Rhipicephalus microplus]
MTTDAEAGNHVVQRNIGSPPTTKRCLALDRTPLERILLVLLIVMTSVCAIMLILLARPPAPQHRVSLNAAAMLRNMDMNVDPCADFYEFACGRWKLYHVLPPDRPHSDTFAVMKDEIKVVLKVEGSENFDHLGFFNVHPNQSTRAYNISASIGNAAAVAGIRSRDLRLSSRVP